MDLELDGTQRAIHDACTRLFERSAGAGRARALRKTDSFDRDLLEDMQKAGFLDLFADAETGPLAATLITGWASQAAVLAPIGDRTLTAPSVIEGEIPLVVAVADAASANMVRYAAEADLLVFLDGKDAYAAKRGEFDVTPARTKFGYPVGGVSNVKGVRLAAGAADIARNWRRTSTAAEIAGAALAAIELTIKYLGDRVQFGQPIASFQAVQHRLVECYVWAESAQWQVREAAARGAPAELATSAAMTASETAHRVFYEAHQLTGAMGFTIEYDLHLWTMRLQTLRQEMGGARAHARDLVAARWGKK
ncbi:butyryl-CoA dehydrogenase [alpha proteobacterium U9-1i]|nr:butyryl-CoA dehydrogenase [alpha proteobacterium U9-1i]